MVVAFLFSIFLLILSLVLLGWKWTLLIWGACGLIVYLWLYKEIKENE